MRKCYAFLGATLCLSLTTHAQNSALNLIGTNYVTTGVDVVNPNGDFTIEFWAYVPHTMNDGGTHQMVSEGSTGLAFYIGYGPDGAIRIGDAWGSTGVPMVFDKWIHIALSSNSTTFLSDLYINGKLMTEFGGFFFNDDQPFRIGVQTDFSQSFTGKIEEVKAWSTPRTAAQIKGDMFGASDPNDAALVAWYQMNDGHGTSITNDANTNSRNFIVQRSSDGSNFTDIATLDAAGNSQALLDYAYTDPQPLKNNNFYRLKQVDLDGKFIYSAVRLVNFPTAAKLIWFATGKGSAQILLQQGNNQPYAVYDAGGRILRLGQLSNGRTQISQLPPGIYFVRVSASTIEIIL
jgi:hypothetical protein